MVFCFGFYATPQKLPDIKGSWSLTHLGCLSIGYGLKLQSLQGLLKLHTEAIGSCTTAATSEWLMKKRNDMRSMMTRPPPFATVCLLLSSTWPHLEDRLTLLPDMEEENRSLHGFGPYS